MKQPTRPFSIKHYRAFALDYMEEFIDSLKIPPLDEPFDFKEIAKNYCHITNNISIDLSAIARQETELYDCTVEEMIEIENVNLQILIDALQKVKQTLANSGYL